MCCFGMALSHTFKKKNVLYLHGIELIRESSCAASAWHRAIIFSGFYALC